jgi:hypothetical protein
MSPALGFILFVMSLPVVALMADAALATRRHKSGPADEASDRAAEPFHWDVF